MLQSACSLLKALEPVDPFSKVMKAELEKLVFMETLINFFQGVTRAAVLQNCQILYVQKPCHLNFKVRAIF